MTFRSGDIRVALRLTAATLISALLLPAVAHGYTFKPTPAEWAMWPEYCKARYSTLQIAKQQPYTANVPAPMVQTWKTRLGPEAFNAVHHYCAGLAYLQRAGVAQSEQQRKFLLKSAESECRYTVERTPVTSPFYREFAGTLQLVQAMRGSATSVPR